MEDHTKQTKTLPDTLADTLPATFICSDCNQTKPVQTSGGTGYATLSDRPDDPTKNRVCYDCIAYRDLAYMLDHKRITLYLIQTKDDFPIQSPWVSREVTNWPGSLRFKVIRQSRGYHNIARIHYDVWFHGPDNHVWWGVTYGDNTQICHCKRTRDRVE